MATQTKRLVTFEAGLAYWEYDWNDVSMRLTRWRCVNTSTNATAGKVTSQSTGDTITRTIEPGGGFDDTIPIGVANRFGLGVDARGRLTGVDHNFWMEPR